MGLVAAHGNQKVRTKISVILKKLKLEESFGGLIPPPFPAQTQNYDPYD
jgi:hypothetical protein